MTTISQQLKAHAHEYEAFDGHVKFYMLGFNNALYSIYRDRLNAIEPEYRYTTLATGATSYERPPELDDYLRNLAKVNPGGDVSKAASKRWQVDSLWTTSHYNFVRLESRTVDIEFIDLDTAPPEVRDFASYWQSAPQGDVAERWSLYRVFVPMAAINAWVDAYTAAEAERAALAAPLLVEAKEMQSDDPLSEPLPADAPVTSKPSDGTSTSKRGRKSNATTLTAAQ